MSYTKYVMFEDGSFLLISKYTGVEHSTLAQFGLGCSKVTTAGFLYARDGAFESYGKSHSLGKDSVPEDGEKITAALLAGTIGIVEHDRCGFYFAASHPDRAHLTTSDPAIPASMENLQKHRIVESDD